MLLLVQQQIERTESVSICNIFLLLKLRGLIVVIKTIASAPCNCNVMFPFCTSVIINQFTKTLLERFSLML